MSLSGLLELGSLQVVTHPGPGIGYLTCSRETNSTSWTISSNLRFILFLFTLQHNISLSKSLGANWYAMTRAGIETYRGSRLLWIFQLCWLGICCLMNLWRRNGTKNIHICMSETCICIIFEFGWRVFYIFHNFWALAGSEGVITYEEEQMAKKSEKNPWFCLNKYDYFHRTESLKMPRIFSTLKKECLFT